MNQSLRHVTVLEEAHHILKRCSSESGTEGAGLVGKSVEMLTNAIAEMRTYGEGFIIADQSPHSVSIAAIRNTNTKIIMRLPDEMDRRLIGKSVALRDDQLVEIARLPKGVAIVYQNDWLEPVLCQVTKFNGIESSYTYQSQHVTAVDRWDFNKQVLNLLLTDRVHKAVEIDFLLLERGLCELSIQVKNKVALFDALEDRKCFKQSALSQPSAFSFISRLVVDVLGCRHRVQQEIKVAPDFAKLHERLGNILGECVTEISDELALATQHCLMKDFSLECESRLEIYSAWRTSLNARSVL
jgi:hypothetical protein